MLPQRPMVRIQVAGHYAWQQLEPLLHSQLFPTHGARLEISAAQATRNCSISYVGRFIHANEQGVEIETPILITDATLSDPDWALGIMSSTNSDGTEDEVVVLLGAESQYATKVWLLPTPCLKRQICTTMAAAVLQGWRSLFTAGELAILDAPM
jgi:hypothetical protein